MSNERDLTFYNMMRDLGELEASDVPPSFVERFVAASEGRYDEAAAANAACELARTANGHSFDEFQAAVSGEGDIGEWAKVMTTVLGEAAEASKVELSEDDLENVAGGRGIERASLKAYPKFNAADRNVRGSMFDKGKWAALQYNWG
jgi:hypothetical protein